MFLERGYAGTTLRAVAASAGVDAALISYHFRSKEGLFAAAMALTVGPSEVLNKALKAPPGALPERLADAVIHVWEDPDVGSRLAALVSTALHDEEVLRALRGYVEHEIVGRLVDHIGGVRASERAAGVATVLVGMIFGRYVLRVQPMAGMSRVELSAVLVPQLRAALQIRRAPSQPSIGQGR